MAIETYITETGWRVLLEGGLLNNVNSYKVGDSTLIYGIDDGINNPAYFNLPIVGNREGTTMIPICEFANRKPIPIEPLTEGEIIGLDRRIKMSFVSEDCDLAFEQSNINVNVNVDKWIDDLVGLKSIDFDRTVSGIRINIWDYLASYLEEYDMTTSSWKVKELYKSNLDITIRPKSQEDYTKFSMVNPKYMKLNPDGKKEFVNAQGKTRFSSNLLLGFNTKVIDGVDVFGTSNSLGLFADKYGYLVDGVFRNAGDFESEAKSQGTGAYKTIYPAVEIDGANYWLTDDTDYRSVDGTGYMVYGYKNSDDKRAIDALTDKIKLFMKSNGTEIETGVYQINMEFVVELFSNRQFNQAYQNNFIGGNLNYNLTYNENTVSADLYTIN